MFNIISKLIGDSNEKALKKIQPLLAEVNSLENKYISLSHTELKSYTEKLKIRFSNGEDVIALLPDAFAIVREAS